MYAQELKQLPSNLGLTYTPILLQRTAERTNSRNGEDSKVFVELGAHYGFYFLNKFFGLSKLYAYKTFFCEVILK